jgi:hypothetical protein
VKSVNVPSAPSLSCPEDCVSESDCKAEDAEGMERKGLDESHSKVRVRRERKTTPGTFYFPASRGEAIDVKLNADILGNKRCGEQMQSDRLLLIELENPRRGSSQVACLGKNFLH